jgi:hypothetical protein
MTAFFDKSKFIVSPLNSRLSITPGVPFTSIFSIRDVVANTKVISVSSKLYSKDGRNRVEVVSTPTWKAPYKINEPVEVLPTATTYTFQLLHTDILGRPLNKVPSVLGVADSTPVYLTVYAVDANKRILETQPSGTIGIQVLNVGITENTQWAVSTTNPEVGVPFSLTPLALGEGLSVSLVGNFTGLISTETVTYLTDSIFIAFDTTIGHLGTTAWTYTDTLFTVPTGDLELEILVTNNLGTSEVILINLKGAA